MPLRQPICFILGRVGSQCRLEPCRAGIVSWLMRDLTWCFRGYIWIYFTLYQLSVLIVLVFLSCLRGARLLNHPSNNFISSDSGGSGVSGEIIWMGFDCYTTPQIILEHTPFLVFHGFLLDAPKGITNTSRIPAFCRRSKCSGQWWNYME